MQGNILFRGIFLLIGMKLTSVSANVAEIDSITKSINFQTEFPCYPNHSFTQSNCTGTRPNNNYVNTYLTFVSRLKNSIKGLEKAYNQTHYNICQDEAKMNATMDYFVNNKFCEIPVTMAGQDVSHSSPNMRMTTKWILWLDEAEKIVATGLSAEFSSVAAYAKKTACYQELRLCVEESDVNDIINCTLPSIFGNADPQDLIPISCHVLKHVHNFTKILKRSIRSQIKAARKNKKCKKGGKRDRKFKKIRKNRKQKCKKARRNCRGVKRRNMRKCKKGKKCCRKSKGSRKN